MAKESFDKEIQFLRLLTLTSGAYNRQQFADRLGISIHTFDKTIRRLKEIVQSVQQQLPAEQGHDFNEMLRFNYYESADPLLLFLFRAKSLKESESARLALLLTALQSQPLTTMELLNACCDGLAPDSTLPDEKTIRSDLKYLVEVGVVRKEPGGRPYRYAVRNDLLTGLTNEELLDLYDFVDIMANTQLPSVQGYLLRDHLKKTMRRQDGDRDMAEPFLYKYHYYSRILDEAHIHPLLHAIRQRRYVSFLYFSTTKRSMYGSQNTNPLFEKETEGQKHTILPLQVIYDHQYGRWYVLGHVGGKGIMKFRLEGMTQLVEGKPVPEQHFADLLAVLEEKMRYSWLVDTGRAVKVRVRFFNPEGAKRNFIRERVLLQGQWGTITEEESESFIYEIIVNGITEIKPWIRSFGSSCEVLEPERLRKEFRQEWKELQAYYEPV
ncbi:helix-turn-helix transcriptional regulator [Paenibacillus brasilensis]|uniref:DNA-binding transcriptional regulator YafY n=1 Tax=Paenibacillus brasilensis TaxID=128574 RepID=A0ABU0L291_9BACL|nr:WYL domain-containing protein [Paenibacillus brasilensis]MDQ0495811.1 putative DNA-binding transcriptional regulator YafY [Paenibacillus brasilensis]